jgi:uncharacterized protein
VTKFLPQRAAIEQFGAGGFRFAGMSHQGSLLVLPSGMRAWRPQVFADLSPTDFDAVLAERDSIDLLLLGTGATMARLPQEIATHLKSCGISVDAMSTSSAIHVYNVVVAEGRRVAAGFIAVDRAHG